MQDWKCLIGELQMLHSPLREPRLIFNLIWKDIRIQIIDRPALSRTGDADSYNTLADNVLANTKADIRPALYDWVKTQTGWVGGSADPSQSSTPINWSNATDV
jgi:hypothetical protein